MIVNNSNECFEELPEVSIASHGWNSIIYITIVSYVGSEQVTVGVVCAESRAQGPQQVTMVRSVTIPSPGWPWSRIQEF